MQKQAELLERIGVLLAIASTPSGMPQRIANLQFGQVGRCERFSMVIGLQKICLILL
jgi:hypothetical protein